MALADVAAGMERVSCCCLASGGIEGRTWQPYLSEAVTAQPQSASNSHFSHCLTALTARINRTAVTAQQQTLTSSTVLALTDNTRSHDDRL